MSELHPLLHDLPHGRGRKVVHLSDLRFLLRRHAYSPSLIQFFRAILFNPSRRKIAAIAGLQIFRGAFVLPLLTPWVFAPPRRRRGRLFPWFPPSASLSLPHARPCHSESRPGS